MAPFGVIYCYPDHFRAQRAQLVAALNGLEVTLAPDFKMWETNRQPDFLQKFPMGKVPTLECADGFTIAEGAAICMYLASCGPAADQLLGADPQSKARIVEWTFFSENELLANMMPIVSMCIVKTQPYDETRYEIHETAFVRALKRIEVAIQGGRKFLVGAQMTLADVMVAGTLANAVKYLYDAEMRSQIPGPVRYLENMAAMPEFKKAFGELKMGQTRVKPQ